MNQSTAQITISTQLPYTRTLFLASSLTLLSACSILTPKTAESVNAFAEEQRYEQAFDLYSKIPEEQQALIDLDELKEKQNRYLKTLLLQAQKERRSYDFFAAETTLESGAKNLPSEASITKALDDLNAARESYANKHQFEYDLQYALFLSIEDPLLEKLLAAKGRDKSFIKHYEHQQQERQRLSQIVGTAGLQSLAQKNYKQASIELKLAEKLDSRQDWQDGLNTISKKDNRVRYQKAKHAKKQQAKAQQQQAQAKQELQRKTDNDKQQFQQQLKQKHYTKASSTLETISQADSDNNNSDWINSARKNLNKAIDTQLNEALRQGKLLYSKGMIDEAIKTWKDAQSYAPESSELRDHIQRAEAFQARYKELTEK